MDNRPVSFPEWKEALLRASLNAAEREAYRREILAFLHACKTGHAPATAGFMKQHPDRPGIAGPRQCRDDADLHACHEEAGAGGAEPLRRAQGRPVRHAQGRPARRIAGSGKQGAR